MINGKIMIAIVAAPDSRHNPHPKAFTKNNIPNNPYTIDGIPDNVSAVKRTTSTNLFPRFAYSTK